MIKILYDNNAAPGPGGAGEGEFKTGWGFSCLLFNEVLFDTGNDFAPLKQNFKLAGIGLESVKKVVISHEHWDHKDGLWGLLKQVSGLYVYVCKSFSSDFKDKVITEGGVVIETSPGQCISPGIFSSGETRFIYKGQAMYEQYVIMREGYLKAMITGCAHPGIINLAGQLIQSSMGLGLDLLLGGFHFMNSDSQQVEQAANDLKVMGVKRVAPCHCSGDLGKEIFKSVFKENYLDVGAGSEVFL